MKLGLSRMAQAMLLQLGCLAVLPGLAQAQALVASSAIVPGERVSDWLLRTAGPQADVTALHWRVQAERLTQR